jgi:predicted peroxiredoxin
VRSLTVKLTYGAQESPERVSQAFTVAATAASVGVDSQLWLTGNAVSLGLPGAAESFELPYATPLHELRDLVLMDGSLIVCSQCAARRGLAEVDLQPGVRLAGSALFVERILAEGAQALVY